MSNTTDRLVATTPLCSTVLMMIDIIESRSQKIPALTVGSIDTYLRYGLEWERISITE